MKPLQGGVLTDNLAGPGAERDNWVWKGNSPLGAENEREYTWQI